jgi:2-phospho-L-lactate guanylyltransferase
MRTWAIIPVKPFEQAKSRLAGALSPDERAELAETWFTHVLSVVRAAPEVSAALVISRDPAALALAEKWGARTLVEQGDDLNAAWDQATHAAKGADAVLLLPGDLPFIHSDDISAMIALADAPGSVVIAPDHKRDGTNALLIRPPGLIGYAYGMGSFERHAAAALAAGVRPRLYTSERMLDIDVPDDLALYYRRLKEMSLWQTG